MARMKVKEADILIVPDHGGSGPEHWQTRWQQRLSTARRVEQTDRDRPDRAGWTRRIADAVNGAERPVVLVAHSLGVAAAVHAVPDFRQAVAGAFLVAPPDLEAAGPMQKMRREFGPYPREPLPFPSLLVASRNDPWCDIAVAEDIAGAWGSLFIDAGEAGRIDGDAGYGPWPEGSMAFAGFLSRL
jgi:predicted alpha/beta hydrolase family esterase